jgi:hypothetical protein
MQTPWGQAQTVNKLSDHIVQVTTAGHGGIHVSQSRNRQIHQVWRQAKGWYEEDCEWVIVALTFPSLFTAEQVTEAHRVARDYYPDEYGQLFGPVQTHDSYTLRQRAFHEANADRYVVTAAWGYRNNLRGRIDVPEGLVGVVARVGGHDKPSGDEAYFLVPADEYQARTNFGFVIDEERHGAWPEATMQLDMSALGGAVAAAIAAEAAIPAGIGIGEDVIAWEVGSVVTYGGPDEHGSRFIMVIGVGKNAMTVKCPPEHVAPAGTPLADAKDPRIVVSKRQGWALAGQWLLDLPGQRRSQHKLKKDAVEAGRRRLAILDWHAAQASAPAEVKHELWLAADDKYSHLFNPQCLCGGLEVAGFVTKVTAEGLYQRHLPNS